MPIYDGNPGVHLERESSIADGAHANVSRLDLGVHTGTHVDAPLHLLDDGAGAESLELAPMLGAAAVVDATSLEVDLVGIDYLSIGDADAHRELLGAGVTALEGLDLREIEPGKYDLICLPLRVEGSDGAPARAILVG